jgi:hypothetical protein
MIEHIPVASIVTDGCHHKGRGDFPHLKMAKVGEAPSGNQAANREHKPQATAFGVLVHSPAHFHITGRIGSCP